jgi:hypothetical protein
MLNSSIIGSAFQINRNAGIVEIRRSDIPSRVKACYPGAIFLGSTTNRSVPKLSCFLLQKAESIPALNPEARKNRFLAGIQQVTRNDEPLMILGY